jgi:hypothetical protein
MISQTNISALAESYKSGVPRASQAFRTSRTRRQRQATLLDLCAWAIATGRVWLVAQAWTTLEEVIHG